MAATGKTPILLYGSTTATNTPSAGNLTNSSDGCEIAINVADKNLFFKDSTNVVNTVPIRQSNTSSNGWLSSTDWNTFNNKQPAGTYVTSVTGTAPVVSSGGTTPAISMAAANGSTNGYLTSTDWTTFNGKQAALVSGTNIKTVNGTTLLGSGDLGTIGIGYGGTGLTSFTANQIHYGSFSQSAGLTFDGTNFATTGTATAKSFIPSSSTVPTNGLYLPAANTVGIATNSANAVYIDSAGNTGIGQTSPVFLGGTYKNLYVSGGLGAVLVLGETGKTFQGVVSGDYNNGQMIVGTVSNHPLKINTNNAQVAQFWPSGGVSIGNTTDPGAKNLSVSGKLIAGGTSTTAYANNFFYDSSSYWVNIGHPTGTSSGQSYVLFGYNGSYVGAITQNGTTGVLYSSGSDYRLKYDEQPLTNGVETVCKLNPVTYKWKADDSQSSGFLAHEFQQVFPDAVTGEKDAVDENDNPIYQGLDASTPSVIATLVLAIQELNARLEKLENK